MPISCLAFRAAAALPHGLLGTNVYELQIKAFGSLLIALISQSLMILAVNESEWESFDGNLEES